MNKEKFVVDYYPLAFNAGRRYGLNPEIILAQAAIESAWGTSYGATNRRNFFGLTAGGSSNEFWDGSYSISNNVYKIKFREYKTAQDSFFDFARLISQKYKEAYTVSYDSANYAYQISQSSYISEQNGDNRENYRKSLLGSYKTVVEIIKKKELHLSNHRF